MEASPLPYTTLQQSKKQFTISPEKEAKELTRYRLLLESMTPWSNADKNKKVLGELVEAWMAMRNAFSEYHTYTIKVNNLAEQIALLDALYEKKIPSGMIRSFNSAMDHQQKAEKEYVKKNTDFILLLSTVLTSKPKGGHLYSPTKGFR
jgi:hypothetical protein